MDMHTSSAEWDLWVPFGGLGILGPNVHVHIRLAIYIGSAGVLPVVQHLWVQWQQTGMLRARRSTTMNQVRVGVIW